MMACHQRLSRGQREVIPDGSGGQNTHHLEVESRPKQCVKGRAWEAAIGDEEAGECFVRSQVLPHRQIWQNKHSGGCHRNTQYRNKFTRAFLFMCVCMIRSLTLCISLNISPPCLQSHSTLLFGTFRSDSLLGMSHLTKDSLC